MRTRILIGLFVSLFALGSVVSRGASGYALIIASGDFMPGSPYAKRAIPGPRSDAHLMASMFMWRFGFAPQNIKVVGVPQEDAGQIAVGLRSLDKHASYAAIRQGFDWLARVATEPEVPVVIYYAGHGKVVFNSDRSARDVNSQALVTYDADELDANLVRDVQIKAWLNSIGSRRKTVIMDCCFSGDMIREVTDGEGLAGGRTVRGIGSDKTPPSSRRREYDLLRARPGVDGDSTRGRELDDLPPGTVLLAACGKKGHAFEKHLLAADGRPATSVGEFTWALYRILCWNQGSMSYDMLRTRVEERLRERGLATQKPVLLPGSATGEAIGPPAWRDRSLRVPLQSPSGQDAVLGVGGFSGLRTNHELLPAGAGRPIRLSDLNWFDARAAGVKSPGEGFLTVRQFP